MRNFEKEVKVIEKLEFIIEAFEYQIGKAALEVIKKDYPAYLDDLEVLDRPQVLPADEFTEERAIDRDGEFDDWKFIIKEILTLTNQRVVEAVDDIDAFEDGTF